jgi:Rrf2 family nitric oxide-sensitive transcriptional repressor
MRLDLQTDYALRTLIFLAGRPGRSSIGQVAGFFAISKDHVAKVVQQLVRLGYVRSIRGVGGGIELAKPTEEISVGEIVEAFEPTMNLLDCVAKENNCVIQRGCKLRHVLAEAERIQTEFLRGVRLIDVVQPGAQLVDLGVPPGAVG